MGGAAALGEIRRLVFENRWAEAQRLVDQAMLGRPVGQLGEATGRPKLRRCPWGTAAVDDGLQAHSPPPRLPTCTMRADARA